MTKSRKVCFIYTLLGVLVIHSEGQFTVPECRNSAFAPTTKDNGLFITAPCQADAECASDCCSVNGGICRAPLSLEGPPRDFCKNGYTVVFDAERTCENENEAIGQPINGDADITPQPTTDPQNDPDPANPDVANPLDSAAVSLKATSVSYIIISLVNVLNIIQYLLRG